MRKKLLKIKVEALEKYTAELLEKNKGMFDVLTQLQEEVDKKTDELAKFDKAYVALLKRVPHTGECDGCASAGKIRRCIYCARYPELKDRFETKNGGDTE